MTKKKYNMIYKPGERVIVRDSLGNLIEGPIKEIVVTTTIPAIGPKSYSISYLITGKNGEYYTHLSHIVGRLAECALVQKWEKQKKGVKNEI